MENRGTSKKKDVAIVVGGQAGQGISTIESILTMILKRSGYHVFTTKEQFHPHQGWIASRPGQCGQDRPAARPGH